MKNDIIGKLMFLIDYCFYIRLRFGVAIRTEKLWVQGENITCYEQAYNMNTIVSDRLYPSKLI